MIEKQKLIIKADDRGGEAGIIKGIDTLILMGLVTDASCIIQFTGDQEADLLKAAIDKSPLKNSPGIGVLLHANFVTGRPVSDPDLVPSLVNNNGIFRKPLRATLNDWKSYIGRVRMTDFQRELNAQIELFYRRFKHYPHALDAHNMNLWYPDEAASITLKTASQLQIPVTIPKRYTDRITNGPFYEVLIVDKKISRDIRRRRIPSADYGSASYWNSSETLDQSVRRFLEALNSLEPGVTEFFFHPGHPDFTSEDPRYKRGRVRDFEILTDPKVVRKLATLTLSSYKELSEENNKYRPEHH